MRKKIAFWALSGLLALAAVPAAPAWAQASADSVKAAFIPKFARYVQWPASAHPASGEPFHLCMVGSDPFGPGIDQAAAREQIDSSPIVVRRLPSANGAAACHVAFVRGATPTETAGILLALRNRPILTVTDGRFGPQRGIVHFTVAQGRVRFFIDDAAAARSGLSISSRLLALALGVRQRRG